MPLPDSNLPTGSLPWAREIEKQLAALNNATSINGVNNSARDATSQTSVNNLLELMADQVELVTYSTELDASQPQSVTFTSGIANTFTSNTAPLDINITLNKPRKLLINYSTFYKIESITAASSLPTAYAFDVKIFVNNTLVDSQYVTYLKQVTALNDLIYDDNSINLTKLLAVPSGSYKISVTVEYVGTPASGGSMLMSTEGDNLIVTVLQ